MNEGKFFFSFFSHWPETVFFSVMVTCCLWRERERERVPTVVSS